MSHKRNTKGLITFKPGQSGNPKGRPRKYVSQLMGAGYSKSEIHDCMLMMLAMTADDLKSVYENADATVLEKTIAAAIRRGIIKGELDAIETLLTRVHGKPAQAVDVTTNGKDVKPEPITFTLNLNK